VRASNIHGWGLFSDIKTIKAAQKPSQPVAVVTSIDAVTGKVKITWIAPHNGNQTLTRYKVEIRSTILSS